MKCQTRLLAPIHALTHTRQKSWQNSGTDRMPTTHLPTNQHHGGQARETSLCTMYFCQPVCKKLATEKALVSLSHPQERRRETRERQGSEEEAQIKEQKNWEKVQSQNVPYCKLTGWLAGWENMVALAPERNRRPRPVIYFLSAFLLLHSLLSASAKFPVFTQSR